MKTFNIDRKQSYMITYNYTTGLYIYHS